jgi:uncharacterized SAM-binding protein YcdF (DUF218 family)
MIKAIIQSLLTLILLAAVLIGIYAFKVLEYKKAETSLTKAPLIVVLTGGSNRLETAIDLLKNDKATILLISGAHPNTRFEDVFPTLTSARDKKLAECCVIMDPQPRDTQSNASKTAQWVEEHNINNIILVTSDYHMPRSILEFEHFLPSLGIQAYSVAPKDFDLLTKNTWKTYLMEGLKYWGAWVRYNLQTITPPTSGEAS